MTALALLSALALSVAQAGSIQPAPEPRIAAALTEDVVEIRSDFAGTELVIFGAVSGAEPSDDVVVVVRGPARDIRVMEKQRVAGIWVNASPVRFEDVPGYYAVASERPLSEVANFASLRRNAIGVDHLRLSAPDTQRTQTLFGVSGVTISQLGDQIVDYRNAIVRNRTRDQLYDEREDGLERLEGGLYISRLELPSGTPTGTYQVDVYLFRDGGPIATRRTELRVVKAGLERVIFDFAHAQPLAYGILAVILALLAGWLAAALGRQR